MGRRQHASALRHARQWGPALVIAGLLLCFALIAEEVLEGEPIAFDRSIMLALRHASDLSLPIGPPWLDEAARDVTALGSIVVLDILLLVVTGYLFAVGEGAPPGSPRDGSGGAVINTLLKSVFARPRPDLDQPLTEVLTASFPSGHAALSAVCYLTLGAILVETQTSPGLRIFFLAIAMLLTLLVGVSRIYLGVHYPTDVLAGWCFGIAWALICWIAMRYFQRRGEIEPPEV